MWVERGGGGIHERMEKENYVCISKYPPHSGSFMYKTV